MQLVGCDHWVRVLLLIVGYKDPYCMKPNIKNIILLSAAILPVISCKAERETESFDSAEPVVEVVERDGEAEEETSGVVQLLDAMNEHLDGHDRLQTVCVRLRNHCSYCRIHKE